nr:gustatory receptor 20 [Papilio dardanus]
MPSQVIVMKHLEQNKYKHLYIDPVSKFFIIFLSFTGWNRCRVFNVNNFMSKLIFIYSISLNVFLIYFTINWHSNNIYMLSVNALNVFNFSCCSFFSYFFTNNFRAFYEDIHTFNLITGYNFKIGKSSIQNTRFCVAYLFFLSLTYIELWQVAIQVVDTFLKSILPFFSPCLYANRISGEINDLKDLLTSNLHKLNKSDRGPSKTLLKLTKIRTLTFSIFRMFDADLFLPLKLLVLIANYVIILLQFQKVTGFRNP